MIKGKFGSALRSKSDTGQINEALCKVLAHNICVLVQATHELGIELVFFAPAKQLIPIFAKLYTYSAVGRRGRFSHLSFPPPFLQRSSLSCGRMVLSVLDGGGAQLSTP
jgi:hypothetical protein